jgi:hypothetical protein
VSGGSTANLNRGIAISEATAMLAVSISAALSGHEWLLFVTVPVGLVGVWLFVRSFGGTSRS